MTDPSQNIELRTIVDRFVKGLPIPTVGRVLTPDDFDGEDNNYCPPESLDISEVKDLVDNASDLVEKIQASDQRAQAFLNSANPAFEDTADSKSEDEK